MVKIRLIKGLVENYCRLVLLLCAIFLAGSTPKAWAQTLAGGLSDTVAVMSALDEEMALLKAEMALLDSAQVYGIDFYTGRIGRQVVVLAKCGVGKVNAAITALLLIDRFSPSAVLFTGIAGALDDQVKVGDIVVSEALAFHDYGAFLEAGFTPKPTYHKNSRLRNPLYLPADTTLLRKTRQMAGRIDFRAAKGRLPRVWYGNILTGDAFIASQDKKEQIRAHFDALAVEMEGAALAQVCRHVGIPFLVVRSISDTADNQAPADFGLFAQTAAYNAAVLVRALLSSP